MLRIIERYVYKMKINHIIMRKWDKNAILQRKNDIITHTYWKTAKVYTSE